MTNFFVAGALGLPKVLEAVLGAEGAAARQEQACLLDHALVVQDPAHHPVVVPRKGSEVRGVRLLDLSPGALEAIAHYETSFGRSLMQGGVTTPTGQQALQFFGLSAPGQAAEIRLADWAEDWAGVATRMAIEIMAWRGRKSGAELTGSLASMRRRAYAWCSAQARPADPHHDPARDVVVHAHKREYINFFAMEEMDLQHRKFDGSMGPTINRGTILIGEAAVVLPYDLRRDAVLLIEQFRAAIYIGGATSPWTLEPPAGLIDPGETPEQAARRETREEVGLEVDHLEAVGSLYSSSGSSSEYVHVFCGLTDFSSVVGGGGVPSEGEDIRSKVMSFQELMQGVDNRTFQDMPLVTAALWLARHRDRLRAEFGRAIG